MSTTTERDWIEEVGGPVYRSVESLVVALALDWDRLEELRDSKESWEPEDYMPPSVTWDSYHPDLSEELAELEEAAGDCKSRDEARDRIHEDALSVEVRSGWYEPGAQRPAPEEFNILLCTGGPAARIRGELDEHGDPTRAWLEVQDWSKPWTQYFEASQDVLLAYAGCFYFGEGG